MFRNAIMMVSLLSLAATTDVLADRGGKLRNPNRKIMPGHHHPIYRRYGHHGLFHNGFLGTHNRSQTTLSGSGIAKKRRGTL